MSQGQGQVLASYGRHYLVELDTGSTLICYTRGKRNDVAVGDQVTVTVSNASQGVIEAIQPRASLLYRSDAFRTKLFAANVSQLWIVIATEPHFSPELVQRAILAAQAAAIPCAIILNKIDLPARLRATREQLQEQGIPALQIPVYEISAHDAKATQEHLLPKLYGQTTMLMGQSGMGKSSLLNALIPDAQSRTQAISTALHSGRHTTTFTQLYRLANFRLIDSPGFQAFGLAHLDDEARLAAFSEFHAHIAHCRFYNCTHHDEPGCGVRAAVTQGEINAARYALYRQLTAEYQSAIQQRQGW
ncbi:ribosome small subunit-dependent GTPase A [Parvibium lacunae]|uniref:Small ribosomal subunit biogenesis GTPase RsgA n=1 Tax=Parvibium lacunae TaxID=1888893 RepID=A0A368L4F9_9BURK|nr:ribosome small subunit-dependent GTPase A [Parvibium lacunae]RCS58405.1 ribosome small subunit-dependent GTPase A [Parvibium lacunae]